MNDKIILYQFETCPYCIKVRNKLDELGIEYKKIEVPRDRESTIRKEIFKKSKVPTVPIIKIGDFHLGESEDIIKYLEENFSKKV